MLSEQIDRIRELIGPMETSKQAVFEEMIENLKISIVEVLQEKKSF